MSTKKRFTPEEIQHLRANPYTRCVTADTISYPLAFKVAFWALSLQGYTGPAAFRKLDYNTEVLGFQRIQNTTKRIRRETKSLEGLREGTRGIHMRLLHMGVRMNVKKIRRLMRKYRLTCPIRKPNPYSRLQRSIRMGSTAENLVNREFESRGPWAVLLTDITYIPLNGKFCYLSTILDACTKQVLSYAMSESLEVDFVLEMVEQLVQSHGASLNRETVIHGDQGDISLKFIQLVESRELRRSMSHRGNCWDNAPQESFFGHMKDELAGEIPGWTSFADAKASIDRWMDYYNKDRCQWDLAKLSPNEFYNYISTGEYPVGMLPQWVK